MTEKSKPYVIIGTTIVWQKREIEVVFEEGGDSVEVDN